MDRKTLKRHKRNMRELKIVNKALDRLYVQLENVPEVSGKVTRSADDFPYIEEHMTVRMQEPKAATAIKVRIREKETRKKRIEAEIKEVDEFIEGLPEGCNKRIMEMVYLEDMSQEDVAELVGYTQGRIAQIIAQVVKD